MYALWQLLFPNRARLPAANAAASPHEPSGSIPLPTELLLEILSQLAHDDIMHCAAASRQLRAVAQAQGEYYVTARIDLGPEYEIAEPAHLAHLSDLVRRRLPMHLRIRITTDVSWLPWFVEQRRAALLSAINGSLVVRMSVITEGWDLTDIMLAVFVHTAGPNLRELSLFNWVSRAALPPDALRDALAVCTSLRALDLRGIPLPPHPIAALSAVERATITHSAAAGWAGLAVLCASLPAVHALHVAFYADPEQGRALGAATALPQRIQHVTFSLDAEIRDNQWLCGQLQLLTLHCTSVEVRSVRQYAIDSEERQHLFYALINAYFDAPSPLRVGVAWTRDAIPNLILTLSRMHTAPQQRLTIVTGRQKLPRTRNPNWAYMPLAAYVSRLRALTIDAVSLDVFLDLVPLMGDLEEIRVEVYSGGPPAITRAHEYRVDSVRHIVEPLLYGGDGPVDIARPILVFGVPFGNPPAQVTPIYIATVAVLLQLVSRSLAVCFVLDRVSVSEDA
jgi:hypothetical protein